METTILFTLPTNLNINNAKNIYVSSEFVGILAENHELNIYSLLKKTILFRCENVDHFSFIQTTFFKRNLVVYSSNAQLTVICFDNDDISPFLFNPEKSIALFQKAELTAGLVYRLCQYIHTCKITQLIFSEINSFFLVDDSNTITKISLFPDGLYSFFQAPSFGCFKYSFNGILLGGLNQTEYHCWNATLQPLASCSIDADIICSLSFNQFAALKGNTAFILDKSGKVPLKENPLILSHTAPFLSLLPNGTYYIPPQNSQLCSDSHFLPLFRIIDQSQTSENNYQIKTISHDIYLRRLLSCLPFDVAIPILSQGEGSSRFVAESAIKTANADLIESFLGTQPPEIVISFLNQLIDILSKEGSMSISFSTQIQPLITSFCIKRISTSVCPEAFSSLLCRFRSLLYPQMIQMQNQIKTSSQNQSINIQNTSKVQNGRTINKEDLLTFVIDAVKKNQITSALPQLRQRYQSYSSFELLRTLILQQSWALICQNKISDAIMLIEQLGEDPHEHLREMWRQTTRNKTRAILYDYLHKEGLLSQQDEANHQILLKITTKYPNTSFSSAQKLSASPPLRAIVDDPKLPSWKPIVDLTTDYNENNNLVLKELYKIPDEPIEQSPRYFVGNISLIEAQTPETLKMLRAEGNSAERLWILHCEHRVPDMVNIFRSELQQFTKSNSGSLSLSNVLSNTLNSSSNNFSSGNGNQDSNDKEKKVKRPKCIKFINKYHGQMNTYELETLLDEMCKFGFFAQFELDNFELLLVRLCKNKVLFDQGSWWSTSQLDLIHFFKDFAKFCAQKNLFMPFEMFVISHKELNDVDISDVQEPLIRFIWDLWKKRDPAAATISCMQYLAKSNSTDPVELWQNLPPDSLAPLACYVWNKDPTKFKPDSPETIALSERLKPEYPLLSSLVKGEIPHPKSEKIEPPPSKWRSPIYTSKYDLELHDLIASHFNYDFSKVFTDYYGKIAPGQPPFPHFDHPNLISAPSETPYVHYVKSMLPVSAFEQAVEDNVTSEAFSKLCQDCLLEAFKNQSIRLAALSFVELVDIKFSKDTATDFKLLIAIYDKIGDDSIVQDLLTIYNFSNNDNDSANQNTSQNEEQSNENISSLSNNSNNNNSNNNNLSEKKRIAMKLQSLLRSQDLEQFLLSALLGVRCGLELDYEPIRYYARSNQPPELLLYIDRASELGAHYNIGEVVKIVKEEMPENSLKAHLLFHLTQSLPTEEGPTSTDIPPALVVFRAVRKKDQKPYISLLQEALSRKVQLYALLATSVEETDLLLCAFVTLLTMTDGPILSNFDLTKPPSREQLIPLFLQTLFKLLEDKKSLEVIQSMELFSENGSIVVEFIHFYRAIELFSFRKAEKVLPNINNILKSETPMINDELLGKVSKEIILQTWNEFLTSLSKHCASRSEIHCFRFLQVLASCDSIVSPFLEPRVELTKIISAQPNFRRAVVHCDLLGKEEKIVSDLVLNHSLQLGQAAAKCLKTDSAAATQQWLAFQYSTAATPSQVLEIHHKVTNMLDSSQSNDPYTFIALFASLLPYTQPTSIIELTSYASSLSSEAKSLLEPLLLHLNLCEKLKLEVSPSQGVQTLPSLQSLLHILFPTYLCENDNLSNPNSLLNDTNSGNNENKNLKKLDSILPKAEIKLNIASPVLFGEETLARFFESSLDIVIDDCLDRRDVQSAHLLCEWRNRNPHNIQLLEAVQKAISGENLSQDSAALLLPFGNPTDMQQLLDSIAAKYGWRFSLLSLHYKAAILLGQSTTDLLKRKTTDFLNSRLSLRIDSEGKKLIKELIHVAKLSTAEVAIALAKAFRSQIIHPEDDPGLLQSTDYGENFEDFTKLNESPAAVGEALLDLAKSDTLNEEFSLEAAVNEVLHASLCASDLDECAEQIDVLLDRLIGLKDPTPIIIDIVSHFPDPALLPRLFQYLIAQQKLNLLPHHQLSEKVGRVIMNCARHVLPFDPTNYFDLTLDYMLSRDHAELRMEAGLQLLKGPPDKIKLQNSSHHFLIALAYFLTEKCYSLAMECLKKLSLISLQLELENMTPDILHLKPEQVAQLMCERDFPFALTVAVAYDMDNETYWASAIYAQSVLKKDDEFLIAYQYFRPITSALCDGVVKKYQNSGTMDEGQKDRMKQFLHNIPNLVERYRIAKNLNFTDQIKAMKEINPVVCEWCERVLLNKK